MLHLKIMSCYEIWRFEKEIPRSEKDVISSCLRKSAIMISEGFLLLYSAHSRNNQNCQDYNQGTHAVSVSHDSIFTAPVLVAYAYC